MLATIWFFIWATLWAVYFMLDGFDLGLATLMPFLAKNESDRKAIYGAINPFWDGNEVWLITAGGVTFAAFPGAYATMFSSLYSALMLILFALIVRGAAIGLRDELENASAKRVADYTLTISSFLPALLLGVAFANIFKGIPIDAKGVYHGNLLTLLNPYGLIGGATFLAFFLLHGSIWAVIKTEGAVEERAKLWAAKLWYALTALTVIFLAATAVYTTIWDRYFKHPALLIICLIAVASLVMIMIFMKKGAWRNAWLSSNIFIASVVFFGEAGVYPALLPSSIDPAASVTIFNSASSLLTLKIMLGVAVIFVPIVIVYQTLIYRLFGGKAEAEEGY